MFTGGFGGGRNRKAKRRSRLEWKKRLREALYLAAGVEGENLLVNNGGSECHFSGLGPETRGGGTQREPYEGILSR